MMAEKILTNLSTPVAALLYFCSPLEAGRTPQAIFIHLCSGHSRRDGKDALELNTLPRATLCRLCLRSSKLPWSWLWSSHRRTCVSLLLRSLCLDGSRLAWHSLQDLAHSGNSLPDGGVLEQGQDPVGASGRPGPCLVLLSHLGFHSQTSLAGHWSGN